MINIKFKIQNSNLSPRIFQSVIKLFIFSCLIICGLLLSAVAQVPTPKSVLGFHPTNDRTIADWSQIIDYFQRLDATSDKVKIKEIGKTTLGKPQVVAIISSAENIKNLDRYKQISQKLADPRTIKTSVELENLLSQGKTIVSISFSINSTEIVGSQTSMNLAYELATATDTTTTEILENTILLLIPSVNPDGVDAAANWYRRTVGTKYEGTLPPEVNHHYAGTDNNRDWLTLNLCETRNIIKLFWQEWFPQIVYIARQQSQNKARITIPPYFDIPNNNLPPILLRESALLRYKMAADLQRTQQSGVTTNSTDESWQHSSFSSVPNYHNSIGISSEAASANLMSSVMFTERQLLTNNPSNDPKFIAERVMSDPSPWQGGIWGPSDIARLEIAASRSILEMGAKFRLRYLQNFYELNRSGSDIGTNPSQPLAYVILAGQPREETIARFLEILLWQGIEIYKMNRELKALFTENTVEHSEVPLGSFLVFLNQPQRNNVESIFGKQIYPKQVSEISYTEMPFDVSGRTLPLQMGVDYYGIKKFYDYPNDMKILERVTDINQARQTLNLPPQNENFARLPNPLKVVPRIGLYKSYAASTDEGWLRWLFDTFKIKYQSLPATDIKNGSLEKRFDTIILPSQSGEALLNGLNEKNYPPELTGGIGVTGTETLRKFVDNGGNLICFDESCDFVIKTFNLPLKNTLRNLKQEEFYCPGSILLLNVDVSNSLAKGTSRQTPIYFMNSSAFEIMDSNKIKSVAAYAKKDLLLSGLLLGEKHLNGKMALVETQYGKGRIVLFAFRPHYRGQSFASFPLVFNSLEKN